jgi:hypothetical protein
MMIQVLKFSITALLILIVFSTAIAVSIQPVFAQAPPPGNVGPPAGDVDETDPKLKNPLPTDNVPEIIGGAIRTGLGIVGSIALVLFIYGGFTWMTAGGNAQRVTTGRNILLWASIGLVVIFLSFAILTFIFDAIKGT